MRPLNLIIPMVGSGSRFKEAGYSTYKPFLSINGKFMIDHVVDAFPEYVQKHLIVNPSLLTQDQMDYLKNKPNTRVIELEGHKAGPSYTIYRARDSLPLDESFFIAYVDVFWTWNFDEVKTLLDYDGIVFVRRKFHPHLINNNFSGFCLPDKDPNILKKVSVKGSFTDEWMEEPLVTAVFYVKSGHDMIRAIQRHITEDARTAGEFFSCYIFEDFVSWGKTVYLQDIDFFIHWGVPSQFEDFLRWKSFLSRHPIKGTCISLSKPNELLARSFEKTEFDKQIGTVKDAFFLSQGKGVPVLNNMAFEVFLKENNPNIVYFSYKPSLVQSQLGLEGKQYADLFWFKNESFVPEDIDKIKEMSDSHCFELDQYVNIENPDEVKEVEFWNQFRSIFEFSS